MDAAYHALPGGGEDDDEAGDAVWDQLNDAQSREVQQHESRFQNGDPYGRENPLSIAVSMAHQTAQNAGDALWQTAQRATVAVRDWSTNNSNTNNDYNYANNPRETRQRGRNDANPHHPGDEFDLQFGIQDLWRRGEESAWSPEVTAENYAQNENFSNGMANRNKNKRKDSEAQREKEKPLHGYPFVVLQEGRGDVPGRNDFHHNLTNERDRWGMIGNLDVFLTHLYKYYYHRGLTPMMCSFLVEITCLIFTIWLTRLLLVGVDWSKVWDMNCDEEGNNDDNGNETGASVCHSHLSDYARTDPLSWTSYLLIQGYTGLLLIYAFFQTYMFYQDFFGYAIQCRTILHEKLGLSERKLQGGALSWNEVVMKLVEGQESGSYRIIHYHQQHHPTNSYPSETANDNAPQRNGTAHPSAPPSAAFNLPKNPSKLNEKKSVLDPLQIAQRIMRKENFMLAFWNAGILDCTKIGQRHYWCGVLEWSFYQCVLNFMFNHKYELRPAFCLDSDALKRRLKVCGIVHLCLLPFLFVFMVLNFFLRHVFDYSRMKSSSSSSDGGGGGGIMGHPRWSSAAVWQFREFNELPHAFEKRMEPSYKKATHYCSLFGTSEYLVAVGRLLIFFSGTIGGILVVLGGVMGDDFLFHVQLWGRNLVWYAGIATATYSIGKALEPTKEAMPSVSKNLFEDMDAALKSISQHTHYYPEHWKGRGWDSTVYTSFKTLFDAEVKLFLYELASLILTPYILYFRVSKKAADICEFCLTSKAKLVLSPNSGGLIAGDVCGFSTFDFDTFGDEAWEGRTLGRSAMLERRREEQGEESLTESMLRTGILEDATRMYPKPRARHGKMEKSFFTFQAAHPNWESCFPPSGNSLVHRVEEYRLSTEQALIARERELHVQAATRQLETLARIEEEEKYGKVNNQNHVYNTLQRNMQWNDVQYATAANTPTADAGAGRQSKLPSHSSPTAEVVQDEKRRSQQEHQQQHKLPLQHQHRSSLSKKPQEMIPQIFPLSSQNALRPYAEDCSKYFEDPSSNANPSLGNPPPFSSPPIGHQVNSSIQQETGDNDIPHRNNYTTLVPTPDSQKVQSQSTASIFPNMDLTHQQSSTELLFSSIGTSPSVRQDDPKFENQYNWLERFHEHLEKQHEEVRQQQPHASPKRELLNSSSAYVTESLSQNPNKIENDTHGTTGSPESVPIDGTVQTSSFPNDGTDFKPKGDGRFSKQK